MQETKHCDTHSWDKEQKLLGLVASRVQNLPTVALHLSLRPPQDYRLLAMVALCQTSASASPSRPLQSLQLLPRSSQASQTGHLGPILA